MKYLTWLTFILVGGGPSAAYSGELEDYQQRLKSAGVDMLENLEVSYVYGGSKVGDVKTCDDCNACLERRSPAPKERFKQCPMCGGCSLDCSHFVQLVYAKAGLNFPYITSIQMAELSPAVLERNYHLRPVATSTGQIMEGDMLVYRGHVVIVETLRDRDTADIIHATGGKDIKVPGQGIQRERFAKLSSFRGELLRVIRHSRLDELRGARDSTIGRSASSSNKGARLRPVEKRRAE